MLNLSEEQVYQIANFGIDKFTLFSISDNIAVYQKGYNSFKVLDFENMELKQPIQLK